MTGTTITQSVKDTIFLGINDPSNFNSVLLLTKRFPDSELILNSWYRSITDNLVLDKELWINPEVEPLFYFKTSIQGLIECPLGMSYSNRHFPSYELHFRINGVKPNLAADKMNFVQMLGDSTMPIGPNRLRNSFRPYSTLKTYINGEYIQIRWQAEMTQFEKDVMDNNDIKELLNYRYPEIYLWLHKS